MPLALSRASLSKSNEINHPIYTPLTCCSFGYDDYTTLLLNLPGSAVAFVSVGLGSWLAGRFNARGPVVASLIVPTLLGGALMAWLPANNKPGLLAGFFLINTVGASKY